MIETWQDFTPRVHPEAWVHPSAVVVGDVTLGRRVTVWPTAVLRGDQGSITVGAETNLQDGVIAHATGGVSIVVVGDRCTVGHRATLHGCRIGNNVLVGMGSIVLDNAVVEDGCIIGAGALVPVGARIPSGSLVLGIPGRVVRTLTPRDHTQIQHGCEEYLKLLDTLRA